MKVQLNSIYAFVGEQLEQLELSPRGQPCPSASPSGSKQLNPGGGQALRCQSAQHHKGNGPEGVAGLP